MCQFDYIGLKLNIQEEEQGTSYKWSHRSCLVDLKQREVCLFHEFKGEVDVFKEILSIISESTDFSLCVK